MAWKLVYDCSNCGETHWASVRGDWFCEVCGAPLELRPDKSSRDKTVPELSPSGSGTGNSGNDGTIWDE